MLKRGVGWMKKTNFPCLVDTSLPHSLSLFVIESVQKSDGLPSFQLEPSPGLVFRLGGFDHVVNQGFGVVQQHFELCEVGAT